MNNSVAIIGAGPAGLTAGYQLAKAGWQVDLYEASDSVGGMCRTIELWGQKVDLGPHRFFSQDSRVQNFWHSILEETDYITVNRQTRIYYDGHFFSYPLRAGNALVQLGPSTAIKCLFSYLQEKVFVQPKQAESFEDWVTNAFGEELYDIFFKSYSEKLWGIPCSELDASFAAQRIKKFSLLAAIVDMLGLNRRKHATLVDEFLYPQLGTGMVYNEMANAFEQFGGKLFLKSKIRGLAESGTGVITELGETKHYDKVISTMPLTTLARSMPDLPENVAQACDWLSYRNTILIYLLVDRDDLFDDQWLYIQSPELKLGRVTNFRNWSPELFPVDNRQTVLALEYWCNSDDPIWSAPEAEVIELGKSEMVQTGLVDDSDILKGERVLVPRCYPVYQKGFEQKVDVIRNYLKAELPNVHAIGRYGAFKYNNQDHSILMGLLAAEMVMGLSNHDLWGINTDYEVYQEGDKPAGD